MFLPLLQSRVEKLTFVFEAELPFLGLKKVPGSLTRDLVKLQCKSFLGVKTEDVVEVHLSEAAKNDKKKILTFERITGVLL
jgi:hypothetical protein